MLFKVVYISIYNTTEKSFLGVEKAFILRVFRALGIIALIVLFNIWAFPGLRRGNQFFHFHLKKMFTGHLFE